jgi:chromosomal replication initiation ATPase DnaA
VTELPCSYVARCAALDRRAKVAASRLQKLGALDSALGIVQAYGCQLTDVLGGDRHKYPTKARHHIWMVLRHSLDMSYPEIAGAMGWGDHSSIIYGVRKAERWLAAEYAESA